MRLLIWLNHKRLKRGWMQTMVVLGVALSVGSLLVTLGVARGFEKEFKRALLNFYAHVTLQADPSVILPEAEVREALGKIGVGAYTLEPFLFREALIVHEGKIYGVVLKGVGGSPGLRLGAELAKKTGQGTIKLLLPNNQTVKLQVAGTFQTGLYELDSQFALIELEELQKLFGVKRGVQGYEIRLPDSGQAQAVARQLGEILPPFLGIQNWADDNRPLLEAFALEKWFFRLLIGFMILVSLLNIVAAVCLSIFHHKKWIAVLLALGLQTRKLRLLFALEGIGLALAGVFLGLGLSAGLAVSLKKLQWLSIDPQVYFLEKLPIDFASLDCLMVLFAALLLGGFISWMAAGRIAAIPVREGLQDAS